MAKELLAVTAFFYLLAFGAHLLSFSGKGERGNRAAFRLMQAGFICATFYFVMEAATLGTFVPVIDASHALAFFAWSLAFVYLVLLAKAQSESFGLVLTPVLVFLLGMALFGAHVRRGNPLPPAHPLFMLHILSAFFAYASFAISFAAGVLYLIQRHELKSKHAGTFYHKLPALEDAAARKREAQRQRSALRQQLAKASARSEDELRKSLVGLDAIAIESEQERCRSEITQREQDQASAREAEEQARHALEAIDASDRAAAAREGMESAVARLRGAVRPWARLRLAHALLQEALKRFRERAQAPMVAAASTYFSLMTGGRYVRLEADEEAEKPVLRAVQADGAKKGIEAMSDGTSDQLYLALRLAALDLRRASHPHLPLVLDDVLITSDDERAANILRALSRFAEGGQVLLFTHHRHLIDVARGVLDHQTLAVHTL